MTVRVSGITCSAGKGEWKCGRDVIIFKTVMIYISLKILLTKVKTRGSKYAEPEEVNMLDFLNIYNLKNLVKQKTCYKNPENSSCIDLILTWRNKQP